MKPTHRPLRRIAVLVCALLLPAITTTAATGSTASSAPRPRACASADLRYPFMPGGPRTFGVFHLRIAGGRCPTAHRVARTWMGRFERALRAGRVRLPRSVDGFRFATLPAHAAQTYSERGRRRATTIWFDYVVPNG